MKIPPGFWETTATRHTPLEDVQGIATGIAVAALGVAMLGHLGFLTGGTAGLAFIVTYATGWNFGLVFFFVNLPFFALAIGRMGRAFTIKTILAIAAMSVLTGLQPHVLQFGPVDPLYGAVLAGMLLGLGLLALFRHRASLGGVGILALFVQDRFGWRAGLMQLAFDLTILALSFAVVAPRAVIYSVASAIVLNLLLAVNHRRDRYVAM
ncbi:YitT family protein [Lutibaculum baratangense]|uniref:YitT family protein n=1 Tax=Lutibaculum baratangense TaxID=1358440 RepID=UPI0005904D37|nr:YitT family protein [Lutibaculum baratangense]